MAGVRQTRSTKMATDKERKIKRKGKREIKKKKKLVPTSFSKSGGDQGDVAHCPQIPESISAGLHLSDQSFSK